MARKRSTRSVFRRDFQLLPEKRALSQRFLSNIRKNRQTAKKHALGAAREIFTSGLLSTECKTIITRYINGGIFSLDIGARSSRVFYDEPNKKWVHFTMRKGRVEFMIVTRRFLLEYGYTPANLKEFRKDTYL